GHGSIILSCTRPQLQPGPEREPGFSARFESSDRRRPNSRVSTQRPHFRKGHHTPEDLPSKTGSYAPTRSSSTLPESRLLFTTASRLLPFASGLFGSGVAPLRRWWGVSTGGGGRGMGFFPSQPLRASLSAALARRMRQPHPAAVSAARSFTTSEGSRPSIVHKRSVDILHDPWFNKGTAFSITERDRLDLRGLLPPNVMTPKQQIERFMVDLKRLEVHARDGPSDTMALAKWRILNRLHDRNETMYYKILVENIEEYAPIVYTPTVGLVCQNYSGLFRRPRGMYFSAADRGEMMSMVYNWPADQVDMIVVTDGSRILGLGDLGVQGIGIAIGKLDLYVAAAGINPHRVIPLLVLSFLKDVFAILYLGVQQHRLDGEEYLSVIDEFMEAVFTRWPHVVVQFEDFQSKWAFKLLQRYRNTYRMFNDDVQCNHGLLVRRFGANRIRPDAIRFALNRGESGRFVWNLLGSVGSAP
ncbi:hypothetical protein Taro_053177, partial [Colocasia esculenta]|nr:hypothetical protein [Colocasia esculenta]